ncbi:MAG: DNA polymerase III subunit alpha [Candidatus Peregrinibacteria bacterium]|nr:DNA polymerase III subunit alpha [Candidatus Peregrinibacteria bacterium]
MSFVNLHCHSHYSLLDGFGSPKDIVLRAKELGYPAAALTDHGVTYGLIELYDACMANDMKPILGCEMYIAPRTRFDKEAKVDVRPYHLTLLAKNNVGYKNLLKLVTQANLEGFYYKPRIDLGLLKAHSEGLIALSGCITAQLPRTILSGNEEDIHNVVKTYIDIFGKENYFFEVQDHPLMEDQNVVNQKIKQLAAEYGILIVATNDSHYPRPEDSEVHDIMLCIQTQTNVNDENRMRYVGDFSIPDVKEFEKAMADFPGAIENTLKVADMCNVKLDFGTNLIPSFKTPQNEKAEDYLRQLCLEGLKNRFAPAEVPPNYFERLDFELKTVNSMGFDTYFLIVWDFVRYAKSKEIVVGPGRGSAAGSIIAWSLNITDVDPIGYGLFFERFLNPERISMPDIDIDFADTRRGEVLEYVIEKYGRDNVAQITTFGTLAPKAAIRDVGRALGFPYAEVDKIAKAVPAPVLGKYDPLEEYVKDNVDFKKLYESDPRAKKVIDYAMKLEGTVRQVGTHACAVVISEKPLTEYTALQNSASDGNEIVTQYSAKPIEALGLLKMDFLGLRNLTVIEKTCKIVARTRSEKVEISKIPLNDPLVFKLLQNGDTTGIFQLESAGMRRYLKQLKPTVFDDIVAMGALYRPGPMEWIPDYIKGKHNPDKVHYLHPSFKSILENTYGVAVYQEQILQLARDFAGFSLGEADILRKAVGKKISSLLAEQREKFIKGAVKNGHDEKFAKQVFEDVIEPFAGYGFNKAHAVCYGLIAYQTAYLKALYPVEFMTALLCSDSGNTEKVVMEIKECNEMGLDVLPPSINESFAHFTVVDKAKIRFGLVAIKGLGDGPVKEIIDAREKGGVFKSLQDFLERVPVKILNKKVLQALALSGALDEFGDRKQLAENYDELSKYAKSFQALEDNGQVNLFATLTEEQSVPSFTMRKVLPATLMEKLKGEKDFLGMYVSGHPLKGFRKYIAKKANLIASLTKKNVGKKIIVVGLVCDMKKILTRAGSNMATFAIEDPTARIRALAFSKFLSQFGNMFVEDGLYSISGRLDFRQGQYQLMCDELKVLSYDNMVKNAKEAGSYDDKDKSVTFIRFLDDILAEKEEAENIGVPDVVELPHPEGITVSEDSDLPIVRSVTEENYVIEIVDDVAAEQMKKLKEFLEKNKGDTPATLLFVRKNKKIKLPFGVKVSENFKKEVSNILYG